MSFIEAENISYTYPIAEDFDEFEEKKVKSEKADKTGNENEKSNESEIRQKPAIDKVSLKIEEGQFICILGRNGSGKSTLARHFNALLAPEEGTLWIDGMNSRDEKNMWDIRAKVGMVFQNPDNQIIGTVVDEDVAFGPENLGIAPAEIRERVKRALESVNMTEFAKRSPNHLSGGQKQRVAVAGILAMEPKCIVLDEATAMLDPSGRREVMKTAIGLNKEKKITVIAITHYMDEALQADRIFVMNDGKIILQGTPKEVFLKGKEVEELGLKLPQSCRLANELRKKGLDIPEDVISEDELVDVLKDIFSYKDTQKV